MKPVWIISIILIIILVASVFYVVSEYPGEYDTPINDPDDEIGFYSQRLVINYQDGTKSSDLVSGWLYHDNKKIDDITYSLFVTPESDDRVEFIIQYYNFMFEVSESGVLVKTGYLYPDTINKGAEGRTLLCEIDFDPFDFINYTYPDGTYAIKIIPSGEILMDNETVNLPDEFSFTINMIDERSIGINFG